MAKKPLEDKAAGVHRAKLWEIGFFACNNLSSSLYLIMVSSISYYLIGIVGVASVLAGSIVTIMRVWDGVTDPFVGMILDHTNTKFGKNRPFIVVGQIILFVSTFAMFRLIPTLPTGTRFIAFILLYMVYIIGYTAQCVATKSAQPCLTNDPAQRPMFAMFDSVYQLLAFVLWYPYYLSTSLIPSFTLNSAQHADKLQSMIAQNPNLANTLVESNGVTILNGFYNPEMWCHFQLLLGGISAFLALLAVIGLWRKDRPEYFGANSSAKIGIRDYADVLAHNRGIQMLVVAASTDKLSMNARTNTAVQAVLFGVIFGNYALYSSSSGITAIPSLVLTLLAFNIIACRLGQKKCLIVGTWGSITCALTMAVMILFGAQKNIFALPEFTLLDPRTYGNLFHVSNWSLFGVFWLLLSILAGVFNNMTSNIVIPMTADVTDYEVYRSGRYVPGLIGTVFSFVDKLISSLSSTIVAVAYSVVGFSQALPTNDSPFSMGLMWATIFCYLGMPILGWIANVIAMKFYPLTKEKMEEIQGEIARIKAEAVQAS